MPDKKSLAIQVITEVHQTARRRVSLPTEACCESFEEMFGKEFMLTPDGGLAPASLRIERVKLGKIVYDRPRIGWPKCPFCDTVFTPDHQEVVKTSGD